MIFPDVLTVTAIDADSGKSIEQVAFILRLKAARKNDYYVGPVVTDSAGRAIFSRESCEKTIESAQKMFLMDYYGDLASCGSTAHIQIQPVEYLNDMIHQYEKDPNFWGMGFDDPDRLFSELKSANNGLYEPDELAVREREILQEPTVKFLARPKKT